LCHNCHNLRCGEPDAEREVRDDDSALSQQHFNIRGRLYDNRLSTLSWASDQWNWNRGALLNWYDTASGFPRQNPNGGADNNGNVTRTETWIPNDDQISG
jgi:hypothetical protein